ncbi:sterile alpha motif (SAM) domain-containing protein [Actinidia rufa]|uniref:Sterile alpha motif (SAM) domain-containing protein n=1 Tax=Actinidia rufa TaxID=165716 RepID=A0A7J0FDJ6_9ERIC|nr:sterile alpha motif (SAM) domain-containing protein [Actinidia rufa]
MDVACPKDDVQPMCPGQVVDVSPVLEWLRSLGLSKYEKIFVREEIGWDTLQGLTEEDLFSIGVTALGPRKKIIHALSELRRDTTKSAEISIDASRNAIGETSGLGANKLITDYFPGTVGHRKNDCTSSSGRIETGKNRSDAQRKQIVVKKKVLNKKLRDIPQWCCVPGTPFRVPIEVCWFIHGSDCSGHSQDSHSTKGLHVICHTSGLLTQAYEEEKRTRMRKM